MKLIHNKIFVPLSKIFNRVIISTGLWMPYLVHAQPNNPIGKNTVAELVEAILDVIIQIGIPLAVLGIVWSGFLFVTAQGDEKKLTDAKNNLWLVILGTALIVGAKVISNTLQETLGGI